MEQVTTFHRKVASAFDKLIIQPENCPEWLTIGQNSINHKERTNVKSIKLQIDYLFAHNVQDLVKHRHFLNVLSYRHIDANKIILNEQTRNANNSYGTVDQFIINKMVMDNVKLNQLNISTANIDYKKAFDSVPHDWIIETQKTHIIPSQQILL